MGRFAIASGTSPDSLLNGKSMSLRILSCAIDLGSTPSSLLLERCQEFDPTQLPILLRTTPESHLVLDKGEGAPLWRDLNVYGLTKENRVTFGTRMGVGKEAVREYVDRSGGEL
ncbi:hypothetical protein KI387_001698, partial [Taxus chinensis]